MYRVITLSIVSMILTTCVKAEEPRLQDYFPVAVGSKWHYRSTTTVKSIKDFKTVDPLLLEVKQLETQNGDLIVQIKPDSGGVTETVILNSKGLFRTKTGAYTATPPLRLLRDPLKDGDSWKYTYEISILGGVPVSESATVTFEKCSVPAGDYDAVCVRRKLSFVLLNSTKQEIATWYSPRVGMIKQQIVTDDDVTAMLELEKYEPAM